jgi:gallate dioxygenase
MSLYEVQKLLFHINREPKVFERFLNEREKLIAEYRLTDEERRVLLEMDFRCLYEMGAHSLLLGPLAATLGVSFPEYLAILRGNQP